jgi:hypothetical protein
MIQQFTPKGVNKKPVRLTENGNVCPTNEQAPSSALQGTSTILPGIESGARKLSEITARRPAFVLAQGGALRIVAQ